MKRITPTKKMRDILLIAEYFVKLNKCYMAGAGIEVIVELGPGKILSGLVKKISPEIVALHVEDVESLNETVAYMREKPQ